MCEFAQGKDFSEELKNRNGSQRTPRGCSIALGESMRTFPFCISIVIALAICKQAWGETFSHDSTGPLPPPPKDAAPALSHYGTVDTAIRTCFFAHAAATTSRHVSVADALKARCVLAEVRWRWTLKVL